MLFEFNKVSGTACTVVGYVIGILCLLHGIIIYDITNISLGIILIILSTTLLYLTLIHFGLIFDPVLLGYCFNITKEYKSDEVDAAYFVNNYMVYIPKDMNRLKMIKLIYGLEKSVYKSDWL